MAPKFKMDAKTILPFKTCKFYYFFKSLQDYLNLAKISSTKNLFLKIQNGRKIQYGRFFDAILNSHAILIFHDWQQFFYNRALQVV
jgi:hypothetical protein